MKCTSRLPHLPPSPPVRHVLYLSRLLAAWGDRLWSFLGALFMLVLQVPNSLHHFPMPDLPQPGSMQLVAVYGLASTLSVLLTCAWIGNLVDRWTICL